jgi:tetratricopeptide (TPR) repeat protein
MDMDPVKTRCIPLAFFAVAMIAPVPAALAGPNEDAAREAIKRATGAYNLGAYEEAVKEYEQAYRLVLDPTLLFNIGQSWRLAGKADKALVAYKAYLRTVDAAAPNLGQVKQRVAELERVVVEARTVASTPAASEAAPAPPVQSSGREPVGAADVLTHSPPRQDTGSAIYRQWWFWGGAGVVVTGIVISAVLLSAGDNTATSCGAGVHFCSPLPRR